MKYKLEICVDSVESAINAQTAGADRVELCDNLLEGGTTPSYGSVVAARKNLSIGVHVIIRPRGGDFLYSGLEYDIMKSDIEMCRDCGVNGIVIGILTANGEIDVERCATLTELAKPMTTTFHRAFDMCTDPVRGLEDVISTGASRLLTSGQKNLAPDGIGLIKQMVKQAEDRIIIMPGAGIDETNVALIATSAGVKEIHLTGKKTIESEMIFRKHGIFMGGVPGIPEFSRKIADIDRIKGIVHILKMI